MFHGSNLIPEGLEIGEVKTNGTAEFDELEGAVVVVAYSGDKVPINANGDTIDIEQSSFTVNGVLSSVCFLCMYYNLASKFLKYLQLEQYSSYILSVFSVPRLAISELMNSDTEITTGLYCLQGGINGNYTQTPTTKTLISTPSTLDGYTPKNQKLRTFPYLYIGFNPPNGSSKIYRYEDFTNGTPQFNIMCEVNPNPTVIFIPQNYRGQAGDSLQDFVALNGYPTLSYKNDYFNSWLAQNSEIISLQMGQEQFNYEVGVVQTALNSTANIVNQASQGNLGALVTGGNLGLDLAKQDVNHEYYIKNQMAQVEKQSLLPDTVNLSSSNATLIGYNKIDKNVFTRYNIKRQFAERIDKFFDMYGYITNTVKIPNLNNRPNWNYVKTIGANIIANIPQGDLQTIKNLFDNGITLWHNTNTFLDYSQNNR